MQLYLRFVHYARIAFLFKKTVYFLRICVKIQPKRAQTIQIGIRLLFMNRRIINN